MAKKLTLYQVLRKSGMFASKAELVDVLRSGRVEIDGKVTKNQEFQLNPNTRKVTVDGEVVSLVQMKYYVLNKPFNTSCQLGDKFKSVRDLISREKVGEVIWNSLFSVGRLDVPTKGLLIITNDGAFARKVLDPKSAVVKKYKVLLKNFVTLEQIDALTRGIDIKGKNGEHYYTKPAMIEKIKDHEVYISITEGKFRQVRKMFEAVGNKVMDLERVAIGSLTLGGLWEGDYVQISGSEITEKVFG
jgi:pseudouridine synthase